MKRILNSNSIFYLPLYEVDGSTIISRDAYGHACSVAGATWGSHGRTFDAVDDVINCGSGTSLNNIGRTGDYAFTVEGWINPKTLGENNWGRVVNKGGSETSAGFTLYLVAPQVAIFSIWIGGVIKGVTSNDNAVPLNSWTHLVGVYDGANVKIYTNSIQKNGTAVTGAISEHSASSLLIGDRSLSDRCFDGVIGEVRIYNRALTPQEIQRNYLVTKWRYQ